MAKDGVSDIGLSTLSYPAEGEAVLDIVFVHGLQGNPRETWSYRLPSLGSSVADLTHSSDSSLLSNNRTCKARLEGSNTAGEDTCDAQSGVYWPKDFLAKDFPSARIMTWDYNTNIAKGYTAVNQGNIFAHARNLLFTLVQERRQAPRRDLVFIAHSLGGVVVKEALRRFEADPDPKVKELFYATTGVIFYGTPHRESSDWASFGEGISTVASVVTGMETNSEILHALLPSGVELELCRESFLNQWVREGGRLKVRTYQEGRGLTGLEWGGFNKKVVPDQSSSLDLPGQRARMIDADHIGMCKFKSRKDEGYIWVSGDVAEFIKQAERTLGAQVPELTLDEQGCLKSLSFLEMNSRIGDIKLAASGTCRWLLHHQRYKGWISQSRSLLWIKGKPGTGKSTLLKYILQAAKEEECLSRKLYTISFFFHGQGAEVQTTSLGLLRSLLFQLLEQFPKALASIVETFKRRCQTMGKPEDKWRWHVHELESILKGSLPLVLEESGIRIFIDALDECGEKMAKEIIRIIQHLLNLPATRYALNICLSCRHYPIITPDNCFEILVEHENQEDIGSYIKEELKDTVYNGRELQELQGEIEARSEHVFQWVVLVMPQILRQRDRGKTFHEILTFLRKIPQELDDLYKAIIQSLDKEDIPRSVQLLQWACFARRPLSIPELRCAMNVDAYPSRHSLQEWRKLPNYIQTDGQMEKQLLSLSGGLVEIKQREANNVVQLIHQSVKDYLITKGFCNLDSSLNPTDIAVGRAHLRLSRSCIVYIFTEEIRRAPLQDRKFLVDKYPFLEYATTSWPLHAQAAEEKEIQQRDLFDYIQRPPAHFIQHWVALYQIIDGHSINSPSAGTTILHVASRYNLRSVVSTILNDCEWEDVEVNSKACYGETPLWTAAERGHEALVNLLLSCNGVEVNSGFRGQTPLWAAASKGHEAVVKVLLQRSDIGVNFRDKQFFRTPLWVAASKGHEAVVKLFLEYSDTDVDESDYEGKTPLWVAASEGHEAVVRLLLKRSNIEAGSMRIYRRTPLWVAASKGHEAVVKLFLECSDIKVDQSDYWGKTPLWMAVSEGHEAVVRLLLERSGDEVRSKIYDDRTLLSMAVKRGHETVVKLLLDRSNVEVNSKREEGGRTLLSVAAAEGHEALLEILLERSDIEVNPRDSWGQTPLWLAAAAGYKAVVKKLLGCGNIEVNSKDKEYARTPLWVAAWKGHEAVVKLLLGHSDVEVNSKDKQYDRSPLWVAASKGHETVVKLLLGRSDVDVNSKDEGGRTPLSIATRRRHGAVIKLLLERSDIDSADGTKM
ncbi:MAG: hypothetical protein M1839_005696 [Geoglossum umbratile]|nr:MAG: hypothetical protein M1839_005696 [Geoglossum umbratile]